LHAALVYLFVLQFASYRVFKNLYHDVNMITILLLYPVVNTSPNPIYGLVSASHPATVNTIAHPTTS
jgi:hypothetical protein